MKRGSPIRQRLAALALLGLAFLNFPLLSLPGGDTAGVPNAFLYLFGTWAIFIVLAAWIAEGKSH